MRGMPNLAILGAIIVVSLVTARIAARVICDAVEYSASSWAAPAQVVIACVVFVAGAGLVLFGWNLLTNALGGTVGAMAFVIAALVGFVAPQRAR